MGHPIAERLAVAVAGLVAVVPRLRKPGAGVALVYHRVAPEAGDPDRELLPAIGTADFARQVAILARLYTFTTASQLPELARRRRRGQRLPVAITFDDDDHGHLQHAAPALREHGATATFFLCGGSLDAARSYWWADLQRLVDRGAALPEPLPAGDIHGAAQVIEDMTATEREATGARLRSALADAATERFDRDAVARLASEFEIGFHTRDHHPLDTLDDDELRRALRDGRSALQQATGQPCATIAYPHGRTDRRTSAAVADAGFTAGYTTDGVPLTPASDPMLIGRFEPRSRSSARFALRMAVAPLRRR
jgi:peptidoglycan/xylan/chitin deacetylase (PgdA/CDA1 family)